jgi:hypothetical protein
MRRGLAWTVCAATAALAACDRGPGPGTLTGTVSGPSDLGAAVVEIVGSSVEGFEGLGATRAFDATLPEEKALPPYVRKYRVLLIGEAAGDLRFGIRVRDVDDDFPAVSVVQAADAGNVPILAAGVEARVVGPAR